MPRIDAGLASCGIGVVAVIAILLSPGVSMSGEGSSPGLQVPGPEKNRWFEEVQKRQMDILGFSAAVVQRKRHPLLKEEAVNKGKLLFRKPGFIRWEVDKPEKVVVVMDGQSMTTYYPSRKEAENRDLRDNLASRAALDFLAAAMTLSLPELERRFEVDLFRAERQMEVRLIPRSKWVSGALSSISIFQGEDEGVPRCVVIRGKRGDRTEMSISSVMLNPDFLPDAFELHLGSDVRVTEVGWPEKSQDDDP